jgi:hypothetical protein
MCRILSNRYACASRSRHKGRRRLCDRLGRCGGEGGVRPALGPVRGGHHATESRRRACPKSVATACRPRPDGHLRLKHRRGLPPVHLRPPGRTARQNRPASRHCAACPERNSGPTHVRAAGTGTACPARAKAGAGPAGTPASSVARKSCEGRYARHLRTIVAEACRGGGPHRQTRADFDWRVPLVAGQPARATPAPPAAAARRQRARCRHPGWLIQPCQMLGRRAAAAPGRIDLAQLQRGCRGSWNHARPRSAAPALRLLPIGARLGCVIPYWPSRRGAAETPGTPDGARHAPRSPAPPRADRWATGS